MRKPRSVFSAFLGLILMLAACSPATFSPPHQMHLAPGDHMIRPKIAIDASGVSHITGIVNNRVIYYRTVLGQPSLGLTMTMTGTGTNWRQFDPDIAVTDSGTAYLVWTELRGGAFKTACYQVIPPTPPAGGYPTGCRQLDPVDFSQGNTKVVSTGEYVYALYDRANSTGKVDSLWFKDLVTPGGTGTIYSYTDNSEEGYLYSWDAAVDREGYLHVGYLDNDGVGVSPFHDRLRYCSNRSLWAGTMNQCWFISSTNDLEGDVPVSLTLGDTSGEQYVILASVTDIAAIDEIRLASCSTAGCNFQSYLTVPLPSAWGSTSVIKDVEVNGNGNELALAWIGNNGTTSFDQVYVKHAPMAAHEPSSPSADRGTYKMGLESASVAHRPGYIFIGQYRVFAWAETGLSSVQYYSDDGDHQHMVYAQNCLSSPPNGEIASHGIHLAGVWEACGESYFSAQAYLTRMPVIRR